MPMAARSGSRGMVLELMTAGQVSDDTGAAALPGSLPKAERWLADRGHDADWFWEALKGKGIPMTLGRKSRGKPIRHDKRRERIEIMFGRLKDWRQVATRITTDARRSSSPRQRMRRPRTATATVLL